jgi:hypothetical protein
MFFKSRIFYLRKLYEIDFVFEKKEILLHQISNLIDITQLCQQQQITKKK